MFNLGTPEPNDDHDWDDPMQNRAITPYRGTEKPPPPVDASIKHHKHHQHYHKDESGVLQRCYHHCRHRPWLWLPLVFLTQILLFPLEHQVAEWLWAFPGFDAVADYMGWFTDDHAK